MTKLYRATAAIFLGFIALLLVPAAPAWASGPSISISPPSDPVSGVVSFSWSVGAESGYSLTYVRVWVSGPGTGGSRHYLDCRPSSCSSTQSMGSSQSGTESWDTRSRSGATGNFNGTYTFQIDAQETPNLVGGSVQDSKSTTFHVNNAPGTPAWNGAPTQTSQAGAPAVSISWTYTNPEPDIREFALLRQNPDGSTQQADVSASNPAKQGCAMNNSTYSCTDTQFPASGYGGQYTYVVVALRYTTASNVTSHCQLDSNGNPYPQGTAGDVCIVSPQPWTSKSVTLAEAAPSPTPTDSGSPSPSGTPTTIGVSGGGTTHGNTGGTQVGGVTKQKPGLPGDNSNYADFYTGTYSTQLPYQDRTLILPFGSKPGSTGNKSTIETVKTSGGPLGLSLKDRALLLPLAGGLLLFLGAAHVRRLLADR